MDKKSILINQIHQLIGVEGVSYICVSPEEPDLMLVEIYFDPESVIERLTPEEVILRNYNAEIKHGYINDETTKYDFIDNIKESVSLLDVATMNPDKFNDGEILAKISLWLDSYALHYGIDLQAEKEAVMLKNEGL